MEPEVKTEPKTEEKKSELTAEEQTKYWEAQAKQLKQSVAALEAKLKEKPAVVEPDSERATKAEIARYKEELAREKAENLKLQSEYKRKEKVAVIQRQAKEMNIKDTYLDKIERLMPLDEVELDEGNLSVKMALHNFKTEYPDFFNSTAQRLGHPGRLESKKDVQSVENLNQAYRKAIKERDLDKAREIHSLLSQFQNAK
jgi:hypothetical protein